MFSLYTGKTSDLGTVFHRGSSLAVLLVYTNGSCGASLGAKKPRSRDGKDNRDGKDI
jgi:hypothetical protein